jgi:hypothetical protein
VAVTALFDKTMLTRLQILRRELLRSLNEELKTRGFKRKQFGFYRQASPGMHELFVSFIAHPLRDFDIEVHIFLRHDMLEDFLDQFHAVMDEEDTSVKLATVGSGLGYTAIGEYRRWTVTGEEDLQPVTASILGAFEEQAIPFFARFASLEQILSVCMEDDRPSVSLSSNPERRAEKAVGAAFLLNRRDLFPALVERKIAYFRHLQQLGNDQLDMTEFLALVEEIDRRWAVDQTRGQRAQDADMRR